MTYIETFNRYMSSIRATIVSFELVTNYTDTILLDYISSTMPSAPSMLP